jgi:hypothetical protein
MKLGVTFEQSAAENEDSLALHTQTTINFAHSQLGLLKNLLSSTQLLNVQLQDELKQPMLLLENGPSNSDLVFQINQLFKRQSNINQLNSQMVKHSHFTNIITFAKTQQLSVTHSDFSLL